MAVGQGLDAGQIRGAWLLAAAADHVEAVGEAVVLGGDDGEGPWATGHRRQGFPGQALGAELGDVEPPDSIRGRAEAEATLAGDDVDVVADDGRSACGARRWQRWQRRLGELLGDGIPPEQEGVGTRPSAILTAGADDARRRRGAHPVGHGLVEREAGLPGGGLGLTHRGREHEGGRLKCLGHVPQVGRIGGREVGPAGDDERPAMGADERPGHPDRIGQRRQRLPVEPRAGVGRRGSDGRKRQRQGFQHLADAARVAHSPAPRRCRQPDSFQTTPAGRGRAHSKNPIASSAARRAAWSPAESSGSGGRPTPTGVPSQPRITFMAG